MIIINYRNNNNNGDNHEVRADQRYQVVKTQTNLDCLWLLSFFAASLTENLLWGIERVVSAIFIPFLNSKVGSRSNFILYTLSRSNFISFMIRHLKMHSPAGNNDSDQVLQERGESEALLVKVFFSLSFFKVFFSFFFQGVFSLSSRQGVFSLSFFKVLGADSIEK